MAIKPISEKKLKLELFRKLFVSMHERAAGDQGRPLSQVMEDIRRRIREKNNF